MFCHSLVDGIVSLYSHECLNLRDGSGRGNRSSFGARYLYARHMYMPLSYVLWKSRTNTVALRSFTYWLRFSTGAATGVRDINRERKWICIFPTYVILLLLLAGWTFRPKLARDDFEKLKRVLRIWRVIFTWHLDSTVDRHVLGAYVLQEDTVAISYSIWT